MGTEIERKFLVRSDDWRTASRATKRIRQGYLASGGANSVRVRIIDDRKARLTVKSATSSMVRHEFEYDVPVEDGLELLGLCEGHVIEKVRHLVPAGPGRAWEVDVFAGSLTGLVLAEIELEAVDETFGRPDWLGREVTGERCYANASLARTGKVPV